MRCSQWRGFIIWSRLGHRTVWYMVMNMSVEHFGPIFTVHQMRRYGLTEVSVHTSQSTRYHNPEDYNFYSFIFCIFNALFYCVLQTICMHEAINIYFYYFTLCFELNRTVWENIMSNNKVLLCTVPRVKERHRRQVNYFNPNQHENTILG
jgi:hypothetical protein